MESQFQTVVALLLVTLSGTYLIWRGRQFYLSLKTKSGSRCGGCGSCGAAGVGRQETKPERLRSS